MATIGTFIRSGDSVTGAVKTVKTLNSNEDQYFHLRRPAA